MTGPAAASCKPNTTASTDSKAVVIGSVTDQALAHQNAAGPSNANVILSHSNTILSQPTLNPIASTDPTSLVLGSEHRRNNQIIVVETVQEDDDDDEYVVDTNEDLRVQLFPRQDRPPPAQNVAAAAPPPPAAPTRPFKAPELYFTRSFRFLVYLGIVLAIAMLSYLTDLVIIKLTGQNPWNNEIVFDPFNFVFINVTTGLPVREQANVSSGPSLDESTATQDDGFGKGHTTTPVIMPVDDLGILDLDDMDEGAESLDYAQFNDNVSLSTADMNVADHDTIKHDNAISPGENESLIVDASFDPIQSEDVGVDKDDVASTNTDGTDTKHTEYDWVWAKNCVRNVMQAGFLFAVPFLLG